MDLDRYDKLTGVMPPFEKTVSLRPPAPLDAPPPIVPTDDLPDALNGFVVRLNEYSSANYKDAKKDQIYFWALKTPTILSSALASVSAFKGWTTAAAVLALLAAIAAAVDLLYPRAQLRNAHWSAVHTLRLLGHEMANEWTVGVRKQADRAVLEATILEKGMARLKDVANTVRDAEASLGAVAPAKK